MAENEDYVYDLIHLTRNFLREKHVKYCVRSLQVLPQSCVVFDSTRLFISFFALSTLDLLNALSSICHEKESYIDWIYSLQVTLSHPNKSETISCGFRGSTSCTIINDEEVDTEHYDRPNLVMTYTALASLLILGDNLKRVDKKGIIQSLRELQLPDGSFQPMHSESENDMRFVYCASCISYILDDWSGIDVDRAVDYIQKSITYEGAIAQGPGAEAHGGSTFCAIASLYLMNRLKSALTHDQMNRLKRWCILRQNCDGEVPYHGIQGRPNKPNDTCYSFWIGATLSLLDSYHLIQQEELRNFILSNQEPVTGGIAKWISNGADPMHTYLGICGLSLMDSDNISPINPALNISIKAVQHLEKLQKLWKTNNQER